jgi:type II secretory pathway pseudopilin PulG
MRNSAWRSRLDAEKGFTLFEAIVAVIVAFLFFLIVLQASTVSSASKAQTQEALEVMNWLQKDVESVKFQASTLQVAPIASASLGDDRVYLNPPDNISRFKDGDIISFMTSSPDGKTYTIADTKNQPDGFFKLSSKLQATYPADSLVIVRSRQQASVTTAVPLGSYVVYSSDVTNINPGSQLMFGELSTPPTNPGKQQQSSQQTYDVLNVFKGFIQVKQPLKTNLNTTNSVNLARCNSTKIETGYADDLRDQLVGSDENSATSTLMLDITKTKTSKGRQYTITRMMNIIDAQPYNMLELQYDVSPKLPEAVSLDSFITRVIPDVAFYCG